MIETMPARPTGLPGPCRLRAQILLYM